VTLPEVDARYRTLVEQIPAVVFMAFLDKGIGEAYVSPQIEVILGFSQEEWLNDPVRWYQQIHPEDKARWSIEAAQLFLSGQPLKSLYGSWLVMAIPSGFTVRPRWSAMMMVNRGLFME
jgi:PAS domain-containing protein